MTVSEAHPLDPGDRNPFFISAGVIKTAEQLEPFMRLEDLSDAPFAITIGSSVWPEWSGNATPEHPVVTAHYPDRDTYGNAIGLHGEGEKGLRELKEPVRRLAEAGIKAIISISNLPHENALDVVPKLAYTAAELNPAAIEVNLSCPNGKKPDGSLYPPVCDTPEEAAAIMAETRQAVGPNVLLGGKDSSHINSLAQEIDEGSVQKLVLSILQYINFLTGINSIGNQPFPEITSTGGRGGMSGPIIAGVAKQHLAYTKKYAPDLPYLSVGGVESKNIAIELPIRRAMGALLVGGAQEFKRHQDNVLAVTAGWANRLRS
jgi:dihydroorotate dehydrogenase